MKIYNIYDTCSGDYTSVVLFTNKEAANDWINTYDKSGNCIIYEENVYDDLAEFKIYNGFEED